VSCERNIIPLNDAGFAKPPHETEFMRRIFGFFFMFLFAVLALGIFGLSGWVALARRDALELASAYAAKTVCSNVFMVKRDVDSIA
jgi:hypothetical protein